MKIRLLKFLALFLLLLAACSVFPPAPPAPPTAPPPAATPISATATAIPTEPPTAAPLPTETATTAPSETPVPPDLSVEEWEVRVHPDGGLFPGDQVSFEVILPEDMAGGDFQLSARFGDEELGTSRVRNFGIGDRRQATFQWAWDTGGLEAGEYEISFAFVPVGEVLTHTVTLLPESLQAYPEPGAAWAIAESDCCLVYYVTGTAAERDLESLLDITDMEAELALEQLGGSFEEPIIVVFLPRVLGHGGFAGGEIYISYLDRNYAGNSPGQVLHHEFIHILDGRKGGDLRPSLFVEGLAVYLSGGHFKKEPIVPRAAAVVDLGLYIPLKQLADNFYFEQHEVSYLQGAALIQYMVERWGWEAFEAFYRDIRLHSSNLQSASINLSLLLHFDLSFDELEADFLEYLNSQPEDPRAQADIGLTVEFFDTLRRYQNALDPSAYFLTAWLIRIDDLIERGITADYVRHPSAPENMALETMLVSADLDLRYGNYPEVARMLTAVNRVLDGCEESCSAAFTSDPLAEAYYQLVLAALASGYEPQIIFPEDDSAIVLAWQGSSALLELNWDRAPAGWVRGE